MENIFHILLISIIQGITEFLPVSSSGHLEITKALLGENKVASETAVKKVMKTLNLSGTPIFVK